jgi:uncharacterized cupin superfamily protein
MQRIQIADVPEVEKVSPQGKYHSYSKDLSGALGHDPLSSDPTLRHPFDVTITRLPAGASRCPFHSHSAQWELYIIISGAGIVRDDSGLHQVKAGDVFLFAPGEAHQITCNGPQELVYQVIADNPVGDSCHYPDSGKWLVPSPQGRAIIKGLQTDYFEGEE